MSFRPSVHNDSGAYISCVYGLIFAKFGSLVDPPLPSAIPEARPGSMRGGAGRGAGAKKPPVFGAGQNFELKYLASLSAKCPQTWCASRYPRGRQAHLIAWQWLAPCACLGRPKFRPLKSLILNISGVYGPISTKHGMWVHLYVFSHHSESGVSAL